MTDHQHEADQQEVHVGGHDEARGIGADPELRDDQIRAEGQAEDEEDEAGLDVAADERCHASTTTAERPSTWRMLTRRPPSKSRRRSPAAGRPPHAAPPT